MNRTELAGLNRLQETAVAKVAAAQTAGPRSLAEQDALDREAVGAIDAFATAVNFKWPEISAILDEAIVPVGIREVAKSFAKIANEAISEGADSVVVRLDKGKHGL